MMPLDPRAVLRQVRLTVSDIHDGLLSWIDRTLAHAGLGEVHTLSDFPPDGRTGPTLVVFPYRFGPDPNLHNTARGCSLLGLGPDYRPGATGLPEPWSQLGAFMTDAMLGVWPGVGGNGPGAQVIRPVSVGRLPASLQRWYLDADPAWTLSPPGAPPPLDAAARLGLTARLPSLWYVPGLSVTVSYIVSASAASRGSQPSHVEPTSQLLSALSAVVTAIHHESGFDVLQLPPQVAAPELPGFVRALAAAVQELGGPEDLVTALGDGADTLTRPHALPVQVLLTQELATGELFTLMQALQRPFKATFCLRMTMRLADLLQFGPASEGTPRFGRFVYTPPDERADGAPDVIATEDGRP